MADWIAAGVLLALTIFGARRGLIRALAGLCITVIALVGAGGIASALCEPATQLVVPAIASHIEKRLEDSLPGEGQHSESHFPLAEVLDLLKVDESGRESLMERAEKLVRETGRDLLTAVIESVVRPLLYGILYLISFALLTIVLHLASRLMDAIFHLPVLHTINALGGGAVGFLEGMLLVFLAVWVMGRMELHDVLDGAGPLIHFFLTHSPLDVLPH